MWKTIRIGGIGSRRLYGQFLLRTLAVRSGGQERSSVFNTENLVMKARPSFANSSMQGVYTALSEVTRVTVVRDILPAQWTSRTD